MRCDGGKVTQAREICGLSQQKAAHKAGVHRTVIERMERGGPVFCVSIRLIAEVLGVPHAELIHPAERSARMLLNADDRTCERFADIALPET